MVGVRICDTSSPLGPARVHEEGPDDGPVLVLGHGAGGGVEAPDLRAARDAARALGWGVVRVEQPWRVAGRRVADAPPRLDAAWLDVVEQLRGGPLVVGGRSAGARVACRTATACGAVGVVALAFPLAPPAGRGSDPARPRRDRAEELALPGVPRLVLQGERDAFGIPRAGPGVSVHVVAGADHGFAVRRRDGRTAADVRDEVEQAVRAWLRAQTLT